MKKKAFGSVLSAAVLVLFAIGAFGWDADFEPSTYNPTVGEVVEFAICEPCLESGTYTYAWDFDGDGAVDLDTGEPTAEYAFEAAGFYESEVTLKDADGRRKTARKGILVGQVPAYGVRETVDQGDGTAFVLITYHANDSLSAPGIQESMPSGWQFELLDDDSAMAAVTNPTNRTYDIVWGLLLEDGDERVVSYRLHPGGAGSTATLAGTVGGIFEGARFDIEICGTLESDP